MSISFICLCLFVGMDDMWSEDELGVHVRTLAACAVKCAGRSVTITSDCGYLISSSELLRYLNILRASTLQ